MRARSPIEMDVDLHIVDVRKGSFYDGVVARLLIAAGQPQLAGARLNTALAQGGRRRRRGRGRRARAGAGARRGAGRGGQGRARAGGGGGGRGGGGGGEEGGGAGGAGRGGAGRVVMDPVSN